MKDYAVQVFQNTSAPDYVALELTFRNIRAS